MSAAVVRTILLAVLSALPVFATVSHAADSEEFWPEAEVYYGLSKNRRLVLDSSYAKGLESDSESLSLSAFLDKSLMPIRRTELRSQDWQRDRYLWMRVGYTRVFDAEQGSATKPQEAEDRGVIAISARAPLSGGVWLEARVRADLRWIGGDYSTRYRGRLEANRQFIVRRHPLLPYVSYEWYYDTRYGCWSRTQWKAGSELTLSKHLRFEAYVAGQKDTEPNKDSLLAFGLVAKLYF